jgi:hypothetical protein
MHAGEGARATVVHSEGRNSLVVRKSGVARFDPCVVWRWEIGPAALETDLRMTKSNTKQQDKEFKNTGEITWQIYSSWKIQS